MKTSIYELLFHGRPQALADLDRYQMRWHDCHICAPPDGMFKPVALEAQVEPAEEIAELMRQAPSRSRGGVRE